MAHQEDNMLIKNKTKILIFGKNGQVASNLIRFFELEKNFDVHSYSSLDINFSNLIALKNFLNNLSITPDFIINACAYTNVDKAEEDVELADLINHQALQLIAQYCRNNLSTLIHYSTDYVFDGSGSEAFKEDNTSNLQPLNHYGKTKLLGERAIISSGCNYLIFRVSWIYDQNPSSKNFVNTIGRLAKEREELNIISDQVGSPTSAEFIAKNTIKIIKIFLSKNQKFSDQSHKTNVCKLNKILNLNNGIFMSWYDFALKIIDDLRLQGADLKVKKINPIKSSDYQTKATRPLNSRLANDEFKKFCQDE
jgi:dTDP-4-dehydrorhamnose reductase